MTEGECSLNNTKNESVEIVNSKFEGFGRMTAEALFCGCLAIGRNTGGTKEIIELTGGGFLYSDRVTFNKHIEEVVLFAGTEKYTEMIFSAQKKVEKIFSIEQNTNNIYAFYKQILKENKVEYWTA